MADSCPSGAVRVPAGRLTPGPPPIESPVPTLVNGSAPVIASATTGAECDIRTATGTGRLVPRPASVLAG